MKYNNKSNSLNELRFYLALVVVTIHLAFLTQTELTKNILTITYPLATRAVDLFFVLSGFLIYMSWDKNKSVKGYFYKRFFRLYPLYFLVVISIPLLFIILFGGELDFDTVISYLIANLSFMNFIFPEIPGLFERNNHQIINGALWSLKVEVMFYISLPFIYWLIERAKRPFTIIVVLFSASLFFNLLLLVIERFFSINLGPLYNQLPSKLYLFVFGIVLYKYFDFFKVGLLSSLKLVFIFIFYLSLFLFSDLNFAISIVVCSLLLFFSFINFKFAFFSATADYSYSIYITHFPIIQIMLGFGVEFVSFFDLFLYLIIQSVVSILCWKVVESNCLRISHNLLRNR